ncbi:MAG TPA: DUF3788 family protein [Acidobacteriaceae bacterium]|nr:DUF3788 family protein [Acidobacteriaceae bacterium]
METTNAFVGRPSQPTPKEVEAALGSSAAAWKQFVDWIEQEKGVTTEEWKSDAPKYGWSLRLKRKDRTIVYLAPCEGCFRASFVLGDRALEAARHARFPQKVAEVIAGAPHYGEGTGVRLIVKKPAELPAIRMLAEIKLAN